MCIATVISYVNHSWIVNFSGRAPRIDGKEFFRLARLVHVSLIFNPVMLAVVYLIALISLWI